MKKRNIEFREVQKFTQLWLWILIIAPLLYFIWLLLIEKQSLAGTSDNISPIWQNLLVLLFVSLIPLLFYLTSLRTIIDKAGISLRFFPFQFKYHSIPWESIKNYEIREYKALREYGGWGIRYAGKEKGKAYNVKGNKGLQLTLKNGNRILIGTQKAELLEAFLKRLNKTN